MCEGLWFLICFRNTVSNELTSDLSSGEGTVKFVTSGGTLCFEVRPTTDRRTVEDREHYGEKDN